MNSDNLNIAVAKGDGIGPEIMDAVISIFNAAGVPLNYHYVDMGKSIFDKGYNTGLTPEAMETIEKLGVLLKGPMETPKGKGVKSINVTARKMWNTYANVRQFRSLKGVDTVFSKAGIPIDLTVMRENIEDTYGGIEYMVSYDVALCLRLITRTGSEQFIRYVFEYAKREGRKRVTCAHKSNIMKITDGLFMKVFYDVAKDYPEIEADDIIIDDLCMKLVRMPEKFDVIALTNLQGDIVSDLCAGLVGGLGFAPGANIGDNISIFEAVHGTAPDIQGKNIANPTALLLSSILMLRHVGLSDYAALIENALFCTLEEGVHTGDFGGGAATSVNTTYFAEAIIKNLGKQPKVGAVKRSEFEAGFKAPEKPSHNRQMISQNQPEPVLEGMDLYINTHLLPNEFAEKLKSYLSEKFQLLMISNRGTQVWPTASVFTDLVDYYRVRIVKAKGAEITTDEIYDAVKILGHNFTLAHTFLLKKYGEETGYSLAQGQ